MLYRILIGGFLIGHGLIHLGLGFTPRPGLAADAFWSYFTTDSWLLERWGDTPMWAVGVALLASATLAFSIAGLALFAHQEWWRGMAVAAAIISLLPMAIFWHPALWIGVSLNLAVLVALLALCWPSTTLVGA